MLENKQLAVAVARYVLPSMGLFSTSCVGSLWARLSGDGASTQILVGSGESPAAPSRSAVARLGPSMVTKPGALGSAVWSRVAGEVRRFLESVE